MPSEFTREDYEQMTERQMLELAAVALSWHHAWDEHTECLLVWSDGDRVKRWWQPHRDPGDALRLAIDLGLRITPGKYPGDGCSVEPVRHSTAGCTAWRKNKVEQTLHAIVHAAAEIGKSMKGTP